MKWALQGDFAVDVGGVGEADLARNGVVCGAALGQEQPSGAAGYSVLFKRVNSSAGSIFGTTRGKPDAVNRGDLLYPPLMRLVTMIHMKRATTPRRPRCFGFGLPSAVSTFKTATLVPKCSFVWA